MLSFKEIVGWRCVEEGLGWNCCNLRRRGKFGKGNDGLEGGEGGRLWR